MSGEIRFQLLTLILIKITVHPRSNFCNRQIYREIEPMSTIACIYLMPIHKAQYKCTWMMLLIKCMHAHLFFSIIGSKTLELVAYRLSMNSMRFKTASLSSATISMVDCNSSSVLELGLYIESLDRRWSRQPLVTDTCQLRWDENMHHVIFLSV